MDKHSSTSEAIFELLKNQPNYTRPSKNFIDELQPYLDAFDVNLKKIRFVASHVESQKLIGQTAKVWVITDEIFFQFGGSSFSFNPDDFSMSPSTILGGAYPKGNSLVACLPFLGSYELGDVGSAEIAQSYADFLNGLREEWRTLDPNKSVLVAVQVNSIQACTGISNLSVGNPVTISIWPERIDFITENIEETVHYPLGDIQTFQIGGPGTTASGGGFIGGGFGLEGFIVGAVTAKILNSLTTKTHTESHIYVAGKGFEFVGILNGIEPESLQTVFLPAIAHLKKISAQSGENSSDTLSSEIERLQNLHLSGALNDEEFAQAKAKILGINLEK